MFSILKIRDSDRALLPEKIRKLPVLAVYENEIMTGYCAYRVTGDSVEIAALTANDHALADAAFRTVIFAAQDFTDSYRFSPDFDSWDMFISPRHIVDCGIISEYLHRCC